MRPGLLKTPLWIALLLLPGLSAMAQQATLVADAHVNSALPAVNSGAISNLNVGNGYTALMQFDLSLLPSGTTAPQISRAVLLLYCNRVNTAGAVSIEPVNGAWGEYSVTYATLPTLGGAAQTVTVAQAGAYVAVDVTSLVKGWVAAPSSNNGLALEAKQVLDPRAAFLTQSLMEGVMNFGYGYVVRQRGFTAPAAGKTGTSHDAWFAAYSSNLICVVWVGNDDYTNINLTGAALAAPIWAEFMNRAIKLPQYSDMTGFTAPGGVQTLRLDKATNLPADASCPNDYSAAFLDGTAPQGTCSRMSENSQSFIQKIFGGASDRATPVVEPRP